MVIKLLLISMLLFSNVARAKITFPDEMTVSEFYSLNSRVSQTSEDEWASFELMSGYLMGIKDFNSQKYFIHNNDEAADCINRPLNVWKPLVFDRYKLNKIKGDELFVIHFIKTVEEVCEVDLL